MDSSDHETNLDECVAFHVVCMELISRASVDDSNGVCPFKMRLSAMATAKQTMKHRRNSIVFYFQSTISMNRSRMRSVQHCRNEARAVRISLELDEMRSGVARWRSFSNIEIDALIRTNRTREHESHLDLFFISRRLSFSLRLMITWSEVVFLEHSTTVHAQAWRRRCLANDYANVVVYLTIDRQQEEEGKKPKYV